MNLMPAISTPFPWLTILIGKTLGGRRFDSVALKGPAKGFWPRSLSATAAGKWFIAVLFAIGIAAINSGNNLLYLVAATLLSLIVVSGIMSETTLRGLKVRRLLPRHIFRDTPVSVRVTASNAKRMLPSFSFSFMESPFSGCKSESEYILKLKAGENESRRLSYTFKKRGVVRLASIKISTRFPFGLFIKGKVEDAPQEALVYPRLRPVRNGLVREQALSYDGISAKKKGGSGELYNLREYTFQDDSRFIYWKSAAKTSRLLYKEFEKESERKVLIEFDNLSTEGNDEAFEDAVDEAASLADWFLESGYSVGIKAIGSSVPAGSGKGQLFRILHYLALIRPAGEKGAPRVRAAYL
ncbi:MAG: DUF58 domain-containing protein [Deltaproteobacteria bacterium]|nr:DUF58 domain-containing protein [Deltaproteobacteria bacterium]